jgi:predicted AAA+ superfamily ATPase
MKETYLSCAIQVSSTITDEKTKEREISGLIDALNEYKLNKGYILTMDSSGIENTEGKEIIIIPVWKYMLYPELYP